MKNNITSEEFFLAFAKHRKRFFKAVENTLHRRGRPLKRNVLEDVVSEALLQFVIRLQSGKIYIPTVEKGYAYMMRSCLWNMRDEHDRHTKQKEAQYRALEEDARLTYSEEDGEPECDLVQLEEDSEMSQQDRADAFYRHRHTALMLFLEKLIIEGVFSFKQVNMFKCYFLNGFTFTQLAEVTGYSKSTCFKFVDEVRKHIRENKANMLTFSDRRDK